MVYWISTRNYGASAQAIVQGGGEPERMMEEKDPDAFFDAMLEQMRAQVTNLMAATNLLTPVIREQGEARYEEYLAIMNQSYYRLLRLMDGAATARTLAGDGLSYEPGPLDLAGFCRELEGQVGPLAALAGVGFRYESDLAGFITVGDAGLLRRMLLALISNALRAAGEGGEAGLRLARIGDRAVLTVWDGGPGLDPALLADLERRPHQPGGWLGVGLPLARRIAQLHGGMLVLESPPGRGLRCTVSLPVQKPEPGAVRTPAGRLDPLGGFSPVLVELSSVLPYRAFLPDDVE